MHIYIKKMQVISRHATELHRLSRGNILFFKKKYSGKNAYLLVKNAGERERENAGERERENAGDV